MTQSLTGAATALTAATLWGAGDFTGGYTARRGAPVLVVAFSHGLGLALLLFLLALLRPAIPGTPILLAAFAGGILNGLGLILFYRALSLGSMGLTAAVTGLITAIIPVIAGGLRQGLPSPLQLLGFALATAAIWLMVREPGTGTSPQAVLLGSCAGVCFGVLLLVLSLTSSHGLLWAVGTARVGSTLTGIIGCLVVRPVRPLRGFLSLAAIAGLLDEGGNLIYALATHITRLDIASVLAALYPAVTVLLAVFLLHERSNRAQAMGMLLALLAVVIVTAG